mgnify:FL=1
MDTENKANKAAVYLLSEIFDYSKRMYSGDCGQEYAKSIGLNAIRWKSFISSGYKVAVLDTRLQEEELTPIFELISCNSDFNFVMTVTDPYYENETENPYIRLLFDLAKFSNVKILSKYQPEEVIKDLAELYGGNRFQALNYSYDFSQEIPLEASKKRKIIFTLKF